MHHLHQLAIHFGEVRPERLMPRHNIIDRCREEIEIQIACQAICADHVVGCGRLFKTINQPHPALRGRGWHLAARICIDAANCRRCPGGHRAEMTEKVVLVLLQQLQQLRLRRSAQKTHVQLAIAFCQLQAAIEALLEKVLDSHCTQVRMMGAGFIR
ncbi:hypothetical protein D3C71_990230 [compost metagenome]